MRRCHWIVLAAAMVCSGCVGCSSPRRVSIIDEFRSSEREALRVFNDLLRRQRTNEIDELELADRIENDVLPPWRQMRTRVIATTASDSDRELYAVLRRYMTSRQHAWEAYCAALRSPSDDAARPHYATYHALDAAAVDDARRLGAAFRAM